MAIQANLLLADGQAIPVNKTFGPNGSVSSPNGAILATWLDKSTGIAIGFPRVTLAVRIGSQMTEVRKKIVLPTLETISGSDGGYTPSPKVAYEVMTDETFKLPARSVLQNRKDILAFSVSLNQNPVMTNAVHNYEPTW